MQSTIDEPKLLIQPKLVRLNGSTTRQMLTLKKHLADLQEVLPKLALTLSEASVRTVHRITEDMGEVHERIAGQERNTEPRRIAAGVS